MTLVVADDVSGAESCSVRWVSSLGKSASAYGTYSSVNGLSTTFTCEYTATAYEPTASWQVNHVMVFDKAGHSQLIYDKRHGGPADFSAADFSVANAGAQDTKAPVVRAVSVDQKQINTGATAIITAILEDDLSGVNFVTAHLRSAAGKTTSFYGEKQSANGLQCTYAFVYAASATEPSDNWYIEFISATDNTGNNELILNSAAPGTGGTGADMSGANFAVVNSGVADATAPSILSVAADKTQIAPGESVTLKVVVKEEQSSMGTITVNLLSTHGKAPWVYGQSPVHDAVNHTYTYECVFTAAATEPSARWIISSIWGKDTAGNDMDVREFRKDPYMGGTGCQDFSAADFAVAADASADVTPPALSSIQVSSKAVPPGQSALFTLQATDTQSAVANGVVRLQKLGATGYITLMASVQNGVLSAAFGKDNTAYGPGQYQVMAVELTDAAGNKSYFHDLRSGLSWGTRTDLNAGDFAVETDTAAPVLISLSVNAGQGAIGETITYTLQAEDATGVNNCSIVLRSVYGGVK